MRVSYFNTLKDHETTRVLQLIVVPTVHLIIINYSMYYLKEKFMDIEAVEISRDKIVGTETAVILIDENIDIVK